MQFQENTRTDRRTDGRMDRHYFTGPFWLLPKIKFDIPIVSENYLQTLLQVIAELIRDNSITESIPNSC